PKDAGSAESSATSTLTEGGPQLENEQEVNGAFERVFGGDGDTPTPARRNAEDHDEPESTASLERAGEDDVDPSLRDREPAQDREDEAGGEETGEATEGASGRGKPGEDGGEPTLDPVLRHAAKRAGWKDDEIDELVAAKPEVAE
ncbi:hypothetical protein R0J87_18575, partial [Halomonas sp. SIMBA_159]